MGARSESRYTAFEGMRRIMSGDLAEVVLATKSVLDGAGIEPVSIFDDVTGEPIEVDYRGTAEEVVRRARASTIGEVAGETVESEAPRGPGRPKLGVVAREVTLLPRHWEWLNSQPGGASVALRKLVEEARRVNHDKDRVRQARDAAYRFMTIMAGNEPGFEEAIRALFAGDGGRFGVCVQAWPADVRDHARALAAKAFGSAVAEARELEASSR
jgi:hypothetical protein